MNTAPSNKHAHSKIYQIVHVQRVTHTPAHTRALYVYQFSFSIIVCKLTLGEHFRRGRRYKFRTHNIYNIHMTQSVGIFHCPPDLSNASNIREKLKHLNKNAFLMQG